jgi:Fe-Mn family superoxide dismutase
MPTHIDRRRFIAATSFVTVGAIAAAAASVGFIGPDRANAAQGEIVMSFELPPLPYAHDALAPYMSAETLEYHHDKHHLAYVNNGNNLLKDSGLAGKSLEEIVKESYGKNPGLFNNAGQHYNHIHFWSWMKKGGGGKSLPGKLQAAVDGDLGGYDKFRADFIQAGITQFGSGWAWVAVKDGKLVIQKTPNGESPLVHGATPILGVDVWEHSYYIDYRNLRPKYLEAFVDNLINWDYVLEMYEKAI